MKQSFELGPYFCENAHHAVLHAALNKILAQRPFATRENIALEFGTGSGESARCIARCLPVITFDSFQGLPEDWREGFPAGSFRYDRPWADPKGVRIVEGLFEDTLPPMNWKGLPPIVLVHIDCDLYSSTKTALENLPWENLCRNKAILVFDEFQGFPGCELHEQRAWREYSTQYGLEWEVVGHGHESWGIQLA